MIYKTISFVFNNRLKTIDFNNSPYTPNTTVLEYLRDNPRFKGTKEGCAEGDCGACTVVLAEIGKNGSLVYKAVNSCLVFLPKLHGRQLITIESLEDDSGNLHPIQKAMIDQHGSQCGFCTPGMIMSLFAYYKSNDFFDRDKVIDAISGNLCRCTGYKSIIRAAEQAMFEKAKDHFSAKEEEIRDLLKSIPAGTIEIKKENFLYLIPDNLKDTLALRKKHTRAVIIGGGTDLALKVTQENQSIPEIIDLSRTDELKRISILKEGVSIGGSVTINELSDLSKTILPAINEICRVFASRQIRHMATIAGNIGTASPIGDLIPVLMAYEAEIILLSEEQKRRLPLADFIRGYRQTDIHSAEIIHSIFIPFPAPGIILRAYKISKRKDMDITSVGAAFRLLLDKSNVVQSIKIVYGGMAASCMRAEVTENFLEGKLWIKNRVEDAAELLYNDFSPLSDVRAGEKFRRRAAANLLIKFWSETQAPNE